MCAGGDVFAGHAMVEAPAISSIDSTAGVTREQATGLELSLHGADRGVQLLDQLVHMLASEREGRV